MATLVLTKPITAIDGNDITEITFKPVTGGMYLQVGDLEVPEITTANGAETMVIKTDMRALRRYLELTTNQPGPVLQAMHPRDIAAAKAIISDFLSNPPA